MTSIGYYIADEKLVLDKDKIYTVVMFKQGKKKYNYRELYLGPILISSSSQLFKEKCQKDLIVNEMILNNIKSGHFLYRQKLKKNIKELAERYNIPEGTIKTWTSKLNHPELYLSHGQKRGRPKEKDLTKEDYKERYEILKKYQAFLKAQREKK